MKDSFKTNFSTKAENPPYVYSNTNTLNVNMFCILGHPALSFYFILQGSVNVVVEEENKITGKVTKNVR